MKLRLDKTDSVYSINKKKTFNVGLQQTVGLLKGMNLSDFIDLNKIYESERDKCTEYRLILTIKPYCTNVLFNPFTEIVELDENNNITNNLWIGNDEDFIVTPGYTSFNSLPARLQYIGNTSFNRDNKKIFSTVINPGYDIFDNHLLRTKDTKVINPTLSNSGDNAVYNTIADNYRRSSGENVKLNARIGGLKSPPRLINKHLYDGDELMEFEESVNANLIEDNGWYGFNNKSTLSTVIVNKKTKTPVKINTIPDKKDCSFVDMFPNRELFLFNPIYNKNFNRLDYNWDIILTYPYQNDDANLLVRTKDGVNSLCVLVAEKKSDSNNNESIFFKSATRHNVISGDTVMVFVYNGTETLQMPELFKVNGNGDYGDGDADYWFYFDASRFPSYVKTKINKPEGNQEWDTEYDEIIDFITEDEYRLFEEGDIRKEIYNNILDTPELWIRFRKVVNGFPCVYYERRFTELVKGGLDKEIYKLAFSTTIYDDDCTQVTFTDSIDVDGIKDNLGRPLTSIYVTFVKKCVGNDIMYNTDEENVFDNERIEPSYCFTESVYGYSLSDRLDENDTGIARRELMRDVRLIDGTTKVTVDDNTVSYRIKDGDYHGDIVEFSPSSYRETVIADSAYRFNTYQRDYIQTNDNLKFIYHEIDYDDYSLNEEGFKIREVSEKVGKYNEGYFYSPHFEMPIKESGVLRQDAHFEVNLMDAYPVQSDGIYIAVRTKTSNSVVEGDIVYLCDDTNTKFFEFFIYSKIDRYTFTICPKEGWIKLNEDTNYTEQQLNWLTVSGLLKTGVMVLRIKNTAIPDYAVLVGVNTYLWRDIISIGSVDSSSDTELTFTNGNFYLTPMINFYLKRQDPDGEMGLQNSQTFPTDIDGNKTDIEKSDEHKEEEEMTC